MTGVSAIGAVPAGSLKQTSHGIKELDKNAFLQLLVTQLRWQDPLNPKDNSDFIAQMAQLSALEQAQNLSAGMEKLLKMQGVFQLSLLGREVVVQEGDGNLQRGRVSAVEFNGGAARLVIGGWTYGFEQLVWVEGGGGNDQQD